ncbi:MAG: hypothetical protein WC332_00160 [Clostridia bacterium]|jgi:hypothetical protein
MRIPEKFYRGDDHPKAYTVGELKKVLSELPDDFPIMQCFEEGVMIVVYNYNQEDVHLEFEEIEEDS